MTTKEQLLAVGSDLFLERGYTATGLQDILKTAGVPKGSFYHHFGSKEEFGLRVVERYAAEGAAMLDRCLADDSLPHVARLRRFFDELVGGLDDCDCRGGCLMGSLGQELANVSDPIRKRIDTLFAGWVSRIESCLQRAREADEIDPGADPAKLADYVFIAWEGALQQMRIRRCSDPLEVFLETTFDGLLARPAGG